jgi:hypothetical protein
MADVDLGICATARQYCLVKPQDAAHTDGKFDEPTEIEF